MGNITNNTNVAFKDCTFNNCNINIGSGSGGSCETGDVLAGAVVLGGLWLAFSPIGTVATIVAIGTTVVKGGLLLGLGSSILGIGGVTTKALIETKRENKLLLEGQQTQRLQDSNYIETEYIVLEDKEIKALNRNNKKYFKNK